MEGVREEWTLFCPWRGSSLLWRSRPGSCSRCGPPTLPWSQSCSFFMREWILCLTGCFGLERVSRKLSKKGQGNVEFWKRQGKRRPWSR